MNMLGKGYAIVVIARTKRSKLGVKSKARLRCNHVGNPEGPEGQNRRHTDSRLIQDRFSLTVKLENDIGGAKCIISKHNSGVPRA